MNLKGRTSSLDRSTPYCNPSFPIVLYTYVQNYLGKTLTVIWFSSVFHTRNRRTASGLFSDASRFHPDASQANANRFWVEIKDN